VTQGLNNSGWAETPPDSYWMTWHPNDPLLFLAAFLIGSIPFGLIVGRVMFKSDLRESGSGNIGAANALRSYGKIGGATVLVLDGLKGFIPAYWLAPLFSIHAFGDWHVIDISGSAFVALFAVLGHCYSPWLRFKGGKGVATFLGSLFALSWPIALAFVAIWLLVVVPTRFASLGSIVASLATPFLFWLSHKDLGATIATSLIAIVIVWKHRENIVRLREGRENKLAFGRSGA
jgi:glycerol-3-phosphate acyltransferase PlsY